MTINERIQEAYRMWNIDELVNLQMEATFLYEDYCTKFAELEQNFDTQKVKSAKQLIAQKKEKELTDKMIDVNSRLEAEEMFGNYREYREWKHSIKSKLDLLHSMIIHLRVRNKHLDYSN